MAIEIRFKTYLWIVSFGLNIVCDLSDIDCHLFVYASAQFESEPLFRYVAESAL